MEFSLSDYNYNFRQGKLEEPNYFRPLIHINRKKYLVLKDLHDKRNNTLEFALKQLKKRVDEKTFYRMEALQTRALSYSSASFPAYRFILPEIITEDWLAIVDWHKFQRDHIIHQPMVSYIIQKLLCFGDSTIKHEIFEQNLFGACIENIIGSHSTHYLKDYIYSLLDESGQSMKGFFGSPYKDRQTWGGLFYQASYIAGLFHDLGYPWQYLNLLNSKLDYLGYDSNIPSNDVDNIIKNFSGRLLFYPLNGYKKINSQTPSTWPKELFNLTNIALHKSHGLPGAIGFLHLYDSICDFPNLTPNPVWQFCIEWASVGILMHDMAKLYWNDITKEPELAHLRLSFIKDPISFIVTFADFLQEFERPVAEFYNHPHEVKINYKVNCVKTELVKNGPNSLIIRYYFYDKMELIKKEAYINGDFRLYFDPQYGYLDMSSIGIFKVAYELIYIGP